MGNLISCLGSCKDYASHTKNGVSEPPTASASDKTWFLGAKGDPQSRCNLMFKEAKEYNKRVLSPAEKNLRALLSGAEAMLHGTMQTMEGHLPNVYEAKNPKCCAPKSVGGAGFQQETVQATNRELLAKLDAEVFGPMDRWCMKLATATQKQKALDRAYDEMEKWRREVGQAKNKLKMLEGEGLAVKRGKAEDHLKEVERNEAASIEEHETGEAKQYELLLELNTEALALRDLIRRGLLLVEEALARLREAVPTSDNEVTSQREGSSSKEAPADATESKGLGSAEAEEGAEDPVQQPIPAHRPSGPTIVPMPLRPMTLETVSSMAKPAPLEKVSPMPVQMSPAQ